MAHQTGRVKGVSEQPPDENERQNEAAYGLGARRSKLKRGWLRIKTHARRALQVPATRTSGAPQDWPRSSTGLRFRSNEQKAVRPGGIQRKGVHPLERCVVKADARQSRSTEQTAP